MKELQQEEKIQSLPVASPKLSHYITDQLEEKFHIQSYDIQLNVIHKENGVLLQILYGEMFTHKLELFLTKLETNPDLDMFIQEAGEAITKVLIDDYFKMMTP
jgi:hypothetical protein